MRRPARLAATLALTLTLTLGCGGSGASPPATEGPFGTRTPADLGGLIPVISVSAGTANATQWIVDTGSPVTLLNSLSYGHPQDYSAQETDDLSAFGLTFRKVSTLVMGAFPADACNVFEENGIIGGDLLHFYQLTIDYLGAALYLWDGISASPAIGQDVAAATPVPVRIKGGGKANVNGLIVTLPPTRIIVDGALEGLNRTFLVDSGASLVTIAQSTFEALPNSNRPSITGIPIQTIYGTQSGSIVRLGSITLGDVTVESVPAVVVPDPTLFDQIGTEVGETITLFVGGTFLRNFETTIRYADERLDLAKYNHPVHINPLEFVSPGFDLAAGCSGGLYVAKVYPGSSAEQNGVGANDHLIMIDTQDVASLSLDDANRVLHSYAVGDEVEFMLVSYATGARATVKLVYADLLPPYTG